jgi:hypothetical protein
MAGVGGRRPGAGRKPGSATKKTREIAERAAADGITPLEVMIQAMRSHYEANRLDEAASIAKDAAPYMHPRLQAIQHSGDPDNREPIPFTWLPPSGTPPESSSSHSTIVSSDGQSSWRIDEPAKR